MDTPEKYSYAKFWRCALQVNPVGYSKTYRGTDHGLTESEYNQALLKKCLDLNISVVGLADHGNVENIDALRKVLEPHGIVVFPGFEISSNDKTHYVCLFSEDTEAQDLERYLGRLVPNARPGDGTSPSRLSSEDLISEVDRIGGFIFAAHCTQDSGLLKNKLNHVWKLPGLRAAQIPGDVEGLANVENGFYKKVILNKNDAYRRERPMAIINAKDVAKPEDLEQPGATCLIKMTRPSFSAFKVAFLDPESRIRLNSQKESCPVGKIVSMKVSGGYLDGLHVDFSDHLNTVIGGRGTGKSTLLECIRYALDFPPKGKQALKIHNDIIEENLGKSAGKVELVVVSSSQNGKQYTVSRSFKKSPVVYDSDGNESAFYPRDLLPGIDIYGQNEIYELAQDESSRLKLLDRFLPQEGECEAKIFDINNRLVDNRQRLEKSFSDLDDVRAEVNNLPKLEEQLRSYEDLGVKEKLAKSSLLARERQISKAAKDRMNSLSEALDSFCGSLPELSFISDEAILDAPDKEQLIAMRTILENSAQGIGAYVIKMRTLLDEASLQLSAQYDAWLKAIHEHEADLEKVLRALPNMAGKSGQEVGVAYKRLMGEIERIKLMKARVVSGEEKTGYLEEERRNLLDELFNLRKSRIQVLTKSAKWLNKRLDGKIKVEIVPEADRSPLMKFLLECGLEKVGEKRLAWIKEAETIDPLSLAQSIRKGPEELQGKWKVTPMVAEALARLSPSKLMDLEELELEHRADIFLNVSHVQGEKEFRSLDRLSTGQQCTAILHMLLLGDSDPLLVDQPEDNLDNAFIADRIVSELREAKMCRQFMFATHNANIPVFGDAEWIGVFSGCGLNDQGSIDVPAIRDKVASILEGGRSAFIQRKEKYEF